MPADAITFTARWIFPVSSPPLERGTITIRGPIIETVEPRGARTADIDLGNAAIIPGLVNPHTHLDLSGARGLIPPTDPKHFTDWLRGVIAYRRSRTSEQVNEEIAAGLAECLRFGTTLIGDIAAGGRSRGMLAAAPVRSVVFREMIGLMSGGQDAYFSTRAWLLESANSSHSRQAVSPHAPYSVARMLFVLAEKLCREFDRPYALHLAESPGETELIEKRTGSFTDFLDEVALWDSQSLVSAFDELLGYCRFPQPKLFIHCNYLPRNAAMPVNSAVVYCPRTHAAFGHPPHPFREFQARGVRVCLGTDSLASNPDLDVLAEARFVHDRYPDVPGDVLLKMITLGGAAALGWADETGSLDEGKSADFVAIPLPDRDAADPHSLLFASTGPRRTMFRGEWRS